MANKKKHEVEVVPDKTMSLDQIENEMEKCCQETEPTKMFFAEKKMSMLERLANFKLKKLELDIKRESEVVAAAEPITVEFIDGRTPEQEQRLKKIDEEILRDKGKSQDA